MVTFIQHKNETIAYHKLETASEMSNQPGLIFLGGYRSDMEGTKSLCLEDFCEHKGLAFLRFDYFAHGQSSGDFMEGTISRWLDDVLFALDHLADPARKHILVGSSMGGWLMMLAALKRPERVHALIGIAAAPDFTEDIMNNSLTDHHRKQLEEQGYIEEPSEYSDEPYIFTKKLLEDGKQNLLLTNTINITCPVQLLHGKKDPDVAFEIAFQIKEKLSNQKTNIIPIEDGDHRLSREQDLAVLIKTIKQIIPLDDPTS